MERADHQGDHSEPRPRKLSLESVSRLSNVRQAEWDRLVDEDDPFAEHAFLRALEESGSVGEGTGWYPQYLLARDANDRLVGAVPLYLKTNSLGEYIFDWGWADAAMAAGIPYYPKLVAAIPFTPVTGRRLLCAGQPEVADALATGARAIAAESGVSSLHLLFVTSEEQARLCGRHGFMPRVTYQFRWRNHGFESFDAYLATFRNGARKNVRRERRQVALSGLRLETLEGEQIDDAAWDALYAFYRDTTGRKWGQAYLTREFFQQMREGFAHRVVAMLAYDDARPIAGALHFQKGSCLYGRYWGCLEQIDALHFELCYYRPIELCIERGWRRFEAGAQGIHKLKRGLLPEATYSSHWLRHPALAEAIEAYLMRERRHAKLEIDQLGQHSPFRR